MLALLMTNQKVSLRGQLQRNIALQYLYMILWILGAAAFASFTVTMVIWIGALGALYHFFRVFSVSCPNCGNAIVLRKWTVYNPVVPSRCPNCSYDFEVESDNVSNDAHSS